MNDRKSNGIILYTQPGCAECLTLKNYLLSEGIAFEERNASYYVIHLLSYGFNSVPIIEIDGKLYSGKELSLVTELLREKGYLKSS